MTDADISKLTLSTAAAGIRRTHSRRSLSIPSTSWPSDSRAAFTAEAAARLRDALGVVDARHHQDEIITAGFADGFYLMAGTHHAIEPGFLGQFGELHHARHCRIAFGDQPSAGLSVEAGEFRLEPRAHLDDLRLPVHRVGDDPGLGAGEGDPVAPEVGDRHRDECAGDALADREQVEVVGVAGDEHDPREDEHDDEACDRHSGGGGTHMIARLKPGVTVAEMPVQGLGAAGLGEGLAAYVRGESAPGLVVGVAFGLALIADFRVTCKEARFAANFTAMGYHPGFGMTVTLPRIVGHQRARWLDRDTHATATSTMSTAIAASVAARRR